MTKPEIESRALALRDEADGLRVINLRIPDQATYDKCASRLRDVVTVRADVVALFSKPKSEAFKAHRAICDEETELLQPITQAEQVFKSLIAAYESDMLQKQQALEAAARRKAVEDEAAARLRLIEQEKQMATQQIDVMLEEAQTYDEAAAILGQAGVVVDAAVSRAREEVLIPQVVEVEPVMRPARGISTQTTYQVEVEDMKELCRAISAGEIIDSMVTPNFSALNKYASATKGKMVIPGCKVHQGTQVSARKR